MKYFKTKMSMMNRMKLLLGLGLVLLFVAGCDSAAKWRKQERADIQRYIQSLGDTAYVLKPSGLYYIELQAGTGRSPIAKDTISYRFTVLSTYRYFFASNVEEVSPFVVIVGVYQLIPGLDEGVRLMKEGGKARFLIPSNLAYGETGFANIPGITPTLWEVELLSVKAGPGK